MHNTPKIYKSVNILSCDKICSVSDNNENKEM